MATILQIMNADRNLSLFSRGLKSAELETKLNEIGPYTILGPVNLAINRLSSLTYEQLLETSNHDSLVEFISNYVLVGKKMMDDFRNDQKLQTLGGGHVTVTLKNGETRINGAKILSRDRQGSNGVIHLLDKTYDAS